MRQQQQQAAEVAMKPASRWDRMQTQQHMLPRLSGAVACTAQPHSSCQAPCFSLLPELRDRRCHCNAAAETKGGCTVHSPGVLRIKSSSLLGLLACCRCCEPCVPLLRLCCCCGGGVGGLTTTGVLLLLLLPLLLPLSGRFSVRVCFVSVSRPPLTVRRA